MAEYSLLLAAIASVVFAAYLMVGAKVGNLLHLIKPTIDGGSAPGGGIISGQFPNDGKKGGL